MNLSRNEVLLLNALKEVRKAHYKELMEKTGLNKDGVLRGLYFLSEKGLVKLNVEEKTRMELTEEGKKAMAEMPDLKLLKYNGKRVSEIPVELRQYIGPMKDSGMINIVGGKLKVLKKEGYPLLNALKHPEKAGKLLNELKRRGYIKVSRVRDYFAEITKEGLRFETKEGVKRLNSEMLEKWKELNFAPLNIKWKDVKKANSGKLHPLTMAINKIKQIFVEMGFEEMEGNYVEESFWNFDALFQPQDHPSRELADTFYVKGEKLSADEKMIKNVKEVHERYWKYKWNFEEAKKLVLRTHTTVLSARTLANRKRGKFFAVGRVFRNEAIDFKHLAEFHQVEGIVAWKNANFKQLLWLLKEFYKKLGFEKIRFRPSYFPYTEPSLEIEVFYEPKQEWMELGGAGIFRKQVVEPLNAEWPVLAFGLSLERPLMMLFGIDDIRAFYKNDLDWLNSIKRTFI